DDVVAHLDGERVLGFGPVEGDPRDVVVAHVVLDHGWLVVRMLMTETREPGPRPLCCKALWCRSSTGRSPASPRSCHQHSVSCATPVAPIGWPLASSPPEGLTGMRPVRAVSPARDAIPPLPLSTKPRSSMSRISVIVKQSWTSAQSMSGVP